MNFLFGRGRNADTLTAQYQNLNTKQYHAQYYENNADHMLVDVRTPQEFVQGHLPGAINIPLNALPGRTNEVPTGKPAIIVCATGNRSITASQILAAAGHTDVYNLQGGTMAWMMSGLPLER